MNSQKKVIAFLLILLCEICNMFANSNCTTINCTKNDETISNDTIVEDNNRLIDNYGNTISDDIFHFTAQGYVSIRMERTEAAPLAQLEYCTSTDPTWRDFEQQSTTVTVSNGVKVYIRAKTANNGLSSYDYLNFRYNYFTITNNVTVGGNIVYLLDPTGKKTPLTAKNYYGFSNLFTQCNKITDASQLDLSNYISPYCYYAMFNGCTSLTTAPELPAGATEGCYAHMFNGCCALTTAPELPTTGYLGEKCYSYMFYACTSLTTAPELPATNLSKSCYDGMFRGCTGLTTAPTLPANNLAEYCYKEMFSNCIGLSTTPALPATNLAAGCYQGMFRDCTGLTEAPELPASTLSYGCYQEMFKGCTGLNTAPELSATHLAQSCYEEMFNGCTGLTSAPELPNANLEQYCCHGMFRGCTGLTTVPALPATNLAWYCYCAMFQDCTGLTEAPELPATALANHCYDYMFANCSSLNHVATHIQTWNEFYTSNWLLGVSATGVFENFGDADISIGEDGIPAGWTEHRYKNIIATASSGGTVSGGGEYYVGSTCVLTATPNNNYSFQKWVEDINGVYVLASTDSVYSFTVSTHRTLIAIFVVNPQYTITATSNPTYGGNITGAGTYYGGNTVSMTATANTGYTFVNWTENGNVVSTNPNYSFTVTGNRTLTANFSLNTYNIQVSANPTVGGTVTGGGGYNYGATATVAATAATGYTFVNWTENGNVVSTNPNYSFTITGNRNLTANFCLNSYNIQVLANPEIGGCVNGGGNYDHGETVVITAIANEEYTFVNWTENGNVVAMTPNYSFTATENRTLTANFSINSYDIQVLANPVFGGNVTGGGNYDYGETVVVIATANEGYSFVNWTENGNLVATTPNYSFTSTENRTLTANFSVNSYNVQVLANPVIGGSVTSGGNYTYGETVIVTATANEGYFFVNWDMNGSFISDETTYQFVVTNDITLTANFAVPDDCVVVVTTNPLGAGNITGVGSYHYGETVTVTATANNGYTFANWTENGNVVSSNSNYSFIITENRVLQANFDINSYNIQVLANPVIGGSVTGDGDYNYGETVTVTATANEGYSFVNWTENGNVVAINSSYSFIVSVNRILTANYIHVDDLQENNEESIDIYPNPTNNTVNVECKGMTNIDIYSYDGRCVKRISTNGDETNVNLYGLPNGIYILMIKSNSGVYSRPIVKK